MSFKDLTFWCCAVLLAVTFGFGGYFTAVGVHEGTHILDGNKSNFARVDEVLK